MYFKIQKRVIGFLNTPYAVDAVSDGKGRVYVFASEDRLGPYVVSNRTEISCIGSAGGTMSVIWEKAGESFWSIQRFFPVFDSKEACILYSYREPDGSWRHCETAKLPYAHRIAVFTVAGSRYMLACTLCANKDFVDDWSTPGSVYVGKIPENPTEPIAFQIVYGGIYKNHGLTQYGADFLVSGREGVFSLRFAGRPLTWQIEPIFGEEAGEAVLFDLNGDGKDELIVIHGFHGDKINIYTGHPNAWALQQSIDNTFGHVLWAGTLLGERCILAGSRGKDKTISLCRFPAGKDFSYERTVIDTKVGPTQLKVIEEGDAVLLLSANHAANEAAEYRLEKV